MNFRGWVFWGSLIWVTLLAFQDAGAQLAQNTEIFNLSSRGPNDREDRRFGQARRYSDKHVKKNDFGNPG
jgi:hypothetical protein